MPVYGETYIKARVRAFEGVIKTDLLGSKVPKETNITLALPAWLLILL